MKTKEHITANLILKNAKELFLKNGFEGTSISDIAALCGINKSLIYHHFNNKEELWRAIKDNMVKNYVTSNDQEINFSADNLKQLIQEVVALRFNFYADNPDMIRLMCWQRLEDHQEKVSGIKDSKYNDVVSQILSLQKQGKVRDDMDPNFCSYLIFSNAVNPFLDQYEPVLSVTLDQREEYIKQIVDTLYMGLKKG